MMVLCSIKSLPSTYTCHCDRPKLWWAIGMPPLGLTVYTSFTRQFPFFLLLIGQDGVMPIQRNKQNLWNSAASDQKIRIFTVFKVPENAPEHPSLRTIAMDTGLLKPSHAVISLLLQTSLAFIFTIQVTPALTSFFSPPWLLAPSDWRWKQVDHPLEAQVLIWVTTVNFKKGTYTWASISSSAN